MSSGPGSPRHEDIRARMRNDIGKVLRDALAGDDMTITEIIDAVVDEAMFPVEHLLDEIEDCRDKR